MFIEIFIKEKEIEKPRNKIYLAKAEKNSMFKRNENTECQPCPDNYLSQDSETKRSQEFWE